MLLPRLCHDRRRWLRVGHVVHDRFDCAEIRVDGFQVIVVRISEGRPRHRRQDFARRPHVTSGANRLDEHLLGPDPEPRVLVRRDVCGVAHSPRTAEHRIGLAAPDTATVPAPWSPAAAPFAPGDPTAFDAAERRAESCERPTVEAAPATMKVITIEFFMCVLVVEIRISMSAGPIPAGRRGRRQGLPCERIADAARARSFAGRTRRS